MGDITHAEWLLLRDLEQLLTRLLSHARPHLIVYLRLSPEQALRRCNNRERDEESMFSLDHMRRLYDKYEAWLGIGVSQIRRVKISVWFLIVEVLLPGILLGAGARVRRDGRPSRDVQALQRGHRQTGLDVTPVPTKNKSLHMHAIKLPVPRIKSATLSSVEANHGTTRLRTRGGLRSGRIPLGILVWRRVHLVVHGPV